MSVIHLPIDDGVVWEFPFAPEANLSIETVARSLSRIPRFSGLWPKHKPYSVARHSMVVASVVPDPIKIHALMHDAHEFLTGDMMTPVQKIMEKRCPGFEVAWLRFKADIQLTIYEKLKLPLVNTTMIATIEAADRAALRGERKAHINDYQWNPNEWSIDQDHVQLEAPIPNRLYSPEQDYTDFLSAYAEYRSLAGCEEPKTARYKRTVKNVLDDLEDEEDY